MGQLVSSPELQAFLDSNVAAQAAQVTGPYSRLFGQAPTFVTYYSQDLARGSADVNLGGSIQIAGPESSLRYKRVRLFPLYGVQAADLQASYDEVQGSVTPSVGGEVYLLPGTVQPFENDFFTVSYLSAELAFRVTQASADRIEGKSFFKLQYFLDQSSPLDLERQTTGTYQFEIASVGTDASPLLEEGLALSLARLGLVCDRLRAAYWRAFYDQTCGAPVLRGSRLGPLVHSTALDLFLSRTNCLSSDGYLQNRTVLPPEPGDRGLFEQTVYPLTAYWLSENALPWPGSSRVWGLADLVYVRPLTPLSQFFELASQGGMLEAVPVPAPDGTPLCEPGGPCFGAGADAIAAALAAGGGIEGLGGPRPLQLLAQRCLAGAYRAPFGSDPKPCADSLAGALNDTALLAGREDLFFLGPIAVNEAALLRRRATATAN